MLKSATIRIKAKKVIVVVLVLCVAVILFVVGWSKDKDKSKVSECQSIQKDDLIIIEENTRGQLTLKKEECTDRKISEKHIDTIKSVASDAQEKPLYLSTQDNKYIYFMRNSRIRFQEGHSATSMKVYLYNIDKKTEKLLGHPSGAFSLINKEHTSFIQNLADYDMSIDKENNLYINEFKYHFDDDTWEQYKEFVF